MKIKYYSLLFFYLILQTASSELGWRRRRGGHKLRPGVWARLGGYQHSEERPRTCSSQRFRCSLHLCHCGWCSERMHKAKCHPFPLQVSGRSRCLSQSYTVSGGLASHWVETSWCWRAEEATRCLLCTSTEEEPGSCWGPCSDTSSWTSKQQFLEAWQLMWPFRQSSAVTWMGKTHDMVSVVAIRSPVDGRLFLAYPHDSGALSQSFDKLQLLDDGGSDLVSVVWFDFICFYVLS